jgi:hypothetical protein
MIKNEKIFFQNLEIIIGQKFVKAKTLSKPVAKEDIFLDKNYLKYQFPDEINNRFTQVLSVLLCNEELPSGSLSHHIDGLILNHPKYHTRIIEFDEEQHFNPFRLETLKISSDYFIFKRIYSEHCNNIDCYHRMLCKIRLRYFPDCIPKNSTIFQKFIENNFIDKNYYIKPTKGFNFYGGRMAQRAYYDFLRDHAYLSKKNDVLSETIRFSVFEIENNYCKNFNRINSKELQDFILHKLNLLELT